MYKIIKFSKAERENYKNDYPRSKPAEWGVMYGKMVYRFCDTEAEAKNTLKTLELEDAIQEAFDKFLDEIADEYKVSLERVREILELSSI